MPMMHKIVLVGHDKAPSAALELVGEKLEEVLARDDLMAVTKIVTHCAHGGPPLDSEQFMSVAGASIDATLVITGISSSEELAREEIAAAQIAHSSILVDRHHKRSPSIQYGVYLDTDMGNRYWFDEKVADEVSFAFAPNADEAVAAQKRYPKARVFLTGNPLEEAAAFPVTTREEIRATFEIDGEHPLVLLPGGKDITVNREFIRGVAEATLLPPFKVFDPLVIFSPHPGDQNDPEVYVELLNEISYCGLLVASPAHLDPKHTQHEQYAALRKQDRISQKLFTASLLIPGTDIVVHSASTIAKEAGYQRKPAVNYFTEAAFERNPDLHTWPPVTRDVEEAVYENPAKLAEAMVRLLTPAGFAPMRERQEAVYLKPNYRGAAVDKMVAAIREIMGV